jgi:ABC-type branched-subunit amino acid transport system ATPase component
MRLSRAVVEPKMFRGAISAGIGPNGAGKTTLFNCASSLIPPHAGTIRFDGIDIAGRRPDRITRRGLVRTFQIARGVPSLSVMENLLLYGADQQAGFHRVFFRKTLR